MIPLVKRSILLSIVLLAAAAVCAADKDTPFRAAPASSYKAKQTNEDVTIAAEVFDTAEKAQTAFGKLNPNQHGVLPVLVVIRNGSGDVLRFENLRVEYVAPDRSHLEATPAKDVPYLSGPSRPRPVGGPLPTGPVRIGRNKNPLASPVIDVRSFAAKMLSKGDEASGFFYFQTGHRRGSQLYVTGIRQAGSGKELFYFEIPLD